MRSQNCWLWLCIVASLVVVDGRAWGQQRSSTNSSGDKAKHAGPVVRSYGSEGGFRTEVTSRTNGSIGIEERRQISLLMAQAFEHIRNARNAIDADDNKKAHEEVNKGCEAIKAIHAMLPRATIHTKTTAPDGKVVYEDEREVQESSIPLFEGLLHTETLAPILAARRSALEVAGVHVVDSERIVTEAIANLDVIEGQLARAAKALGENKEDVAATALSAAMVRGVDFRFNKDDSSLVVARDALWLARRSLEENNVAQAVVNLESAKQRLRIYREVLSQDERQDVDLMLREVQDLENQLRGEANQPAGRAQRSHQGNIITSWWDKINSWFRGGHTDQKSQ